MWALRFSQKKNIFYENQIHANDLHLATCIFIQKLATTMKIEVQIHTQ